MQEAGGVPVRLALRKGRIATSRLSEVEVASGLARREREGAVTSGERERAIKSLNQDMDTWVIVELTSALVRAAQTLLVRHNLRSGDALQLASCLYLQQESGRRIPFAGFDTRLNAAARAEGLAVLPFS